MKPVKYIEVILPDALVQAFTDMVENHDFEAYTINTGLAGKSRHGVATAGLSDAAIKIICNDKQSGTLIPAIGSFLEHYGGIGCMIEAQGLAIHKD